MQTKFKVGDMVQWHDPEDARVYHDYELTKIFDNGEAEISSNDGEGTMIVYLDDIEFETNA